jgi:hypothetical protein
MHTSNFGHVYRPRVLGQSRTDVYRIRLGIQENGNEHTYAEFVGERFKLGVLSKAVDSASSVPKVGVFGLAMEKL